MRFGVEGASAAGPLPDEAGQHLSQILREALTNTARHAGACRVKVSLVFAPDELDLIVTDDGCGPAHPAAEESPGQHEGLRNMRERARRLGGRLAVEEAPEGGTRVTLAVPLDSDEPESETFLPDPDREVIPLVTTAPTDPITVLIVDDHTVVRIGLRTLLSNSAGFRVVGEAQTAAEAVQLNEQTRPDVVLMDVRLPDGSGVEACRRIKADHPDARVLMLTSYSDEEAIVGAVMAGASGYLLKQADAERLTQAIREAAAGQSTLDPARRRRPADASSASSRPSRPRPSLPASPIASAGCSR